MINFITGVIGIAMVAAFLAVMLIWVPAPPLIAIVVIVMSMLIIDFVQSLRSSGNDRK
jgi:xanthosine utilization system XapX-like protein